MKKVYFFFVFFFQKRYENDFHKVLNGVIAFIVQRKRFGGQNKAYHTIFINET